MSGRRTRRLTIGSLMACVAALSLILAFLAPLVRQGRPPCMTSAATAGWLLKRPGMASCNECHREVLVADRVRALFATPAQNPPCSAGTLAKGSTSCTSCHAAVRAPG